MQTPIAFILITAASLSPASLLVAAKAPQDCIAFYSQRGCLTGRNVCCLGASCESFYQSSINDNNWPPADDNCGHQCPFINPSTWNCTRISCNDGYLGPSLSICDTTQICLLGQCRALANVGDPCFFHTNGPSYVEYDNCMPGSYCGHSPSSSSDTTQRICIAKRSIGSTCTAEHECISGYCWSGVCTAIPGIWVIGLVTASCITCIVICTALFMYIRWRGAAKLREQRRLQRNSIFTTAQFHPVTVVNKSTHFPHRSPSRFDNPTSNM